MSIEAINWSLKMPGTPTQKHLLMVMANYANESGIAFPSAGTLMADTGMGKRTIVRAKKELLAAGLIEKMPRYGQSGIRLSLHIKGGEKTPKSANLAPQSATEAPNGARNDTSLYGATAAPKSANLAPQSATEATPPNHHLTTINHQYPNGANNAASSGEIIPFSAAGARSPERRQARSARGELFSTGLGIVRSLTGKPDGAARGLLGKWAKTCRDDIATLNAILREAADINPIDPIAWIEGAVKHRFTNGWGQIERDIGFDGRPDLDALAAAVGDR